MIPLMITRAIGHAQLRSEYDGQGMRRRRFEERPSGARAVSSPLAMKRGR